MTASPRTLYCLAIGLLSVSACASSKPLAPPPEQPASPTSTAPSAPSDSPDTEAPAAAAAGQASDSAPPDEVPKDCNFRVKGFCFKTDEDACAAAGCDQGRCQILESHPAQVKCR